MDSSDYRHRFIAFGSLIRWPIGLSALAAAILAYTNQGASPSDLGWYTLTGFELPHYNPLGRHHSWRWTANNVHPYPIIFMATAISGMLEGVGFWNDDRQLLERAKRGAMYLLPMVLHS